MRKLYVGYALSGWISLGYQVVWLRHFVDRFGSSTFTFVLVVCGFIAGIGAGALASRWVTDRVRRMLRNRGDLVLYGVFELAIAAAVLLVYLEGLTPSNWLGAFPYELRDGIYEPLLSYQLLRIPLAVLSVGVPCFFMGITYPLLCHAFREDARLPSALYAWNTLGACSAVLACEWLLLRWLGTDAAFAVIWIVNVLLGIAFLVRGDALERACQAEIAASPRKLAEKRAAVPTATLAAIVCGAALSGVLSGLLEADAFRRVHFAQIYNGAAMAFVSFWAIAAIFAASTLVHRRPGWTLRHVAWAYAAGFALYLVVTRFLLMPGNRWVHQVAADAAGRFAFDPDGTLQILGAVFVVVGWVTFPTYFCASLLLPYLCNVAQAQGRHLGRIYGVNTLAFLTGMIAFSWAAPAVNMFYAFRLATIGFAAIVVALFLLSERRPLSPLRLALPALGFVIAIFVTSAEFDRGAFPKGDPLTTLPVRALKGSTGFSSFVATMPAGDELYLDSGQMSSTTPFAKRYMKVMAHFPLLAQERPKSALLICFGVGNTASAIAKHRSIERLDIVDLARNVLETAPEFAFHNDDIVHDPRVRRIHDDGRSFLDVTTDRYDLVTSEPPPPLMHGISRLYSVEYYRDVSARLTPGGYMTQWLPIFQMPPQAGEKIVATFLAAFPHTLLLVGWETQLLLVGSHAPIDVARVARRFGEDPAVLGDLHDVWVPTADHLLARIAMTDDELRRHFGAAEVISDQKNPLSAYWPTGRLLEVPVNPNAVARLWPNVPRDLRVLRRLVPDYPGESLAAAPRDASGILGTDVPWLEVQRLNREAESALREGQIDTGFRAFDQSLARLPEQLGVFMSRGFALASLGKPAEAIPWLRRATQSFGEYQETWIALASAQAQAGRGNAAIESLQKALALNPRCFQARMMLGSILRQTGDRAGAVEHLRLALELKPMAEQARKELASVSQ